MTILRFPPVTEANEHGLLAVGGDLEVSSLLLAYKSGIFPWPHSDDEILWFSPPLRGILFLDELHIPKSLKKERERHNLTFTINAEFNTVLEACASTPRKITQQTWITKNMIAAYKKLFRAGFCQSFECYENQELIGGGYGVRIGNFFAGESLFHKKDNASKFALWWFCEKLKAENVKWIDCQMVTPLLKSFGAREIPREEYIKLLKTVF